jgi:hypothetical protein
MCVCLCVCIVCLYKCTPTKSCCVCTHTHTNVRTHTHTQTHTHANAHTHTQYTHKHTHTQMCTHKSNFRNKSFFLKLLFRNKSFFLHVLHAFCTHGNAHKDRAAGLCHTLLSPHSRATSDRNHVNFPLKCRFIHMVRRQVCFACRMAGMYW